MNGMESRGLEIPPASPRNSEIDISLSLANYNHKEKQGSQLTIDQERLAKDCISDYNRGAMTQFEQEIDIELRLGRGYNQMKKDEASLASDSGPSFSSSSTDSDAMQKSVGALQSRDTAQMLMGHDRVLIHMPAPTRAFKKEEFFCCG